MAVTSSYEGGIPSRLFAGDCLAGALGGVRESRGLELELISLDLNNKITINVNATCGNNSTSKCSNYLPLDAESGLNLFGEGVAHELLLESALEGEEVRIPATGSRQQHRTKPCATAQT